MLRIKMLVFAVICAFMFNQLAVIMAGEKGGDMILLGGEHGCGPKLLLKSGGKKKGDIIIMNDCHKKKEYKSHYIPYPVYHSYGGHGGY